MQSELRPIFGLVDCNAFYVNCERIFRPELRGRPVVVLSNNDGSIIARSNEAKALGLKMGDPYHEVKHFLRRNGVTAFSSNYSLYGELSHRVGLAISSLAPAWERYSIDELFVRMDGLPEPIRDRGREIQARVLLWTAMPVGVGIGYTKTLAKAAQHASKVWRDRTGGVVDLRNPDAVEWLLRRMPVEDVWGIGGRMRDHLAREGIKSAWELSKADPKVMGRRYNVVLERTIRELQGESCMELEGAAPVKQSICSSKMFGKRIESLNGLGQAVATYIHTAAEKLRQQGSLCGQMRIGIQTSFHGDGPKYSNSTTVVPEYPTDDVRVLTGCALRALDGIYREGFEYSKAEVLLLDLRDRGQFTLDMFSASQPHRTDLLMATMDKINRRWGRECLRTAAMPLAPDWGMKRTLLSPSYMTDWNQLWRVLCK